MTSHARDDGGVFETQGDDRYLPFEGAGAIAEFKLELPTALHAFDYETIQDVVLHMRYTARDGGAMLRAAAESAVTTSLTTATAPGPLAMLFSLRNELSDDWDRLLNATADVTVDVPLDKSRFPYLFDRKNLKILRVEIVAIVADTTDATGYPASDPRLQVTITPPPGTGTGTPTTLAKNATIGNQPYAFLDVSGGASPGTLKLAFSHTNIEALSAPLVTGTTPNEHLDAAFFKDLLLVVHYAFA